MTPREEAIRQRPSPLRDEEMPDREWTDDEWVRNQWHLANEHCASLLALAHQFEAQVATLREALEPFAEMAKDWEGSDFSYGVPVADLEHARAALAATPAAERPT